MDRQTLRDRVHRFNEYGPDGLTDAKGAVRPRSLNDKQMRDVAQIVEAGPDPASDGVVRRRRLDLVRVVRERFGVDRSERSMSDHPAALGFSDISGRPRHPKQDGRVIEAFLPPPKSPEPNPVENIRQYLPSNDLSNRVSAMTTPLSMLLVMPGTRRSIRHRQSHQSHARIGPIYEPSEISTVGITGPLNCRAGPYSAQLSQQPLR